MTAVRPGGVRDSGPVCPEVVRAAAATAAMSASWIRAPGGEELVHQRAADVAGDQDGLRC